MRWDCDYIVCWRRFWAVWRRQRERNRNRNMGFIVNSQVLSWFSGCRGRNLSSNFSVAFNRTKQAFVIWDFPVCIPLLSTNCRNSQLQFGGSVGKLEFAAEIGMDHHWSRIERRHPLSIWRKIALQRFISLEQVTIPYHRQFIAFAACPITYP